MDRKITSIKAQKRNPQRVNIHLDGEFAFGLSRFSAAWLKTGQKLTQSEIEKMIDEDSLEVAYQKALHYMSYRPRSEKEVYKNLLDKDFTESIAHTTIQRLKEKAYVDDLKFARQWIENRNTFRPRSQRLLSYELHNKSVPDDIIQKALEEITISEEELAYQAALSRAEKCKTLDWQSFRNKIGSFLARRGFYYSVTTPVLKRLWDEVKKDPESHYES